LFLLNTTKEPPLQIENIEILEITEAVW
jgi:hypothetical protein